MIYMESKVDVQNISESRLYAITMAFLYRELEQILVSTGGPGTNILQDDFVF